MTDETASQKTVKYAGATVGVSAGNAFAYFALEYLRHTNTYTPDDPVVAMAMGGAVVSILILETKRVVTAVGRGIVYVFDRIFPEKPNGF